MAMTKLDTFLAQLELCATLPNIYATGAIGTPINATNIASLKKQYPKWYTDAKIEARFFPLFGEGYFGYDCNGMIKAAIWGFNGDEKKKRGGAVHGANGLPDFGVDYMSQVVPVVEYLDNDFSNIEIGEIVWMPGHIGVYYAKGIVMECTSGTYGNGIVFTGLGNTGGAEGYKSRNWTHHGKLKCVEYPTTKKEEVDTMTLTFPVVKKGVKGENVKTVQRLLDSYGYKDENGKKLEIDGSAGAKTVYALKAFQKDHGLVADGSLGPKTAKVFYNV